MGIGLYLVREVAVAHGGRALVDSRPGAGSEFTLELPRLDQKGDSAQA
jgi:signal transduction histidine kinase